jgi:hypothetical protein
MISFVSVFLLLWLCWLLLVVCPDLSGRIAERRGRSIRLWWWMAIIFGPIAPLSFLCFRRPANPEAVRQGLRLVDCGAGRSGEPLASAALATAALSWCAPRHRCGRYPTCSHRPRAPLDAKSVSWGRSAKFALWGV